MRRTLDATYNFYQHSCTVLVTSEYPLLWSSGDQAPRRVVIFYVQYKTRDGITPVTRSINTQHNQDPALASFENSIPLVTQYRFCIPIHISIGSRIAFVLPLCCLCVAFVLPLCCLCAAFVLPLVTAVATTDQSGMPRNWIGESLL